VVGRGRKPALPLELENSIVQSVKRTSQLGVGVSRKQLLTRTGTLVKRLKFLTDISPAFTHFTALSNDDRSYCNILAFFTLNILEKKQA
jgi:hypothetical protein